MILYLSTTTPRRIRKMCSPNENMLPDCSAEVRAFVEARKNKPADEMIADITEDQYTAWYSNVYDSPTLLEIAPPLAKWKITQDEWMEGLHQSLQSKS